MRLTSAVFLCFFLILGLSDSASAQRDADWSLDFEGNERNIFFHQSTGIPIVMTDKQYLGIDRESKKVLWTVDRSGIQKFEKLLETESDYSEIPFSELAFVNHNLIEVTTGKKILDKEKDEIKSLTDYYLYADQRLLMVKGVSKNGKFLMALNMKNNEVLWNTVTGKAGMGASLGMGGSVTSGSSSYGFEPTIFDDKYLVYKDGNETSMLDFKTGELKWTNKVKTEFADIHYGKNLLIIAEEGGSLFGGAIYGDKVYAFDLETGVSPWKKELKVDKNIRLIELWEDKLMIAHSDGFNLFDYDTKESIWKKDYQENRIKSVKTEGADYEIGYKANRVMLVDGSTGKKKWKKEKKLNFETEDEVDFSNEADVGGTQVYPNGEFAMIEYPDGKFRQVYARIYTVDFKNQKLVYISNSGFGIGIVDLSKKDSDTDVSLSLKNKYAYSQIEIHDDGYFVFGEQDFSFVTPEGEVKEKGSYKKLGDGKGLLRSFNSLASVAAGAAFVAGTMEMSVGVVGSAFYGTPQYDKMARNGEDMAEIGVFAGDVLGDVYIERINSFKDDDTFAYFFTKKKENKEFTLIKVRKSSGEITDELLFHGKAPVYQADIISSDLYYVEEGTLYVFETK